MVPAASNMDQYDASSHYAGDSSHGGAEHDHPHEATSDKERERIAQSEQQAVTCLRLVLLGVLLVSALVVFLVLYFYTSGKEHTEFESQFESDVFKLFESLGQHLDLTLGAADAFVFKIVSFAKYSGNTFPFVTVPDFGAQAAKVLSSSAAFYLGVYYAVKNEQRLDWEAYTADPNNTYFLDENIQQVQVDDPNFHGPLIKETYTQDFIFDSYAELIPYNDTTDPYVVTYQHYPTISSEYFPPYNWNAMSDASYAAAFSHAMDTKSVVMSAVTNYIYDPSDEPSVEYADVLNGWAAQYIPADEDPSEPMLELVYPMFNTVKKVQIDTNDPNLEPAVGVLVFSTYIRDLIRDILPPNSIGIIVVFKNSQDQVFSYRIDGAETTFLGWGDHHESKYDEMAQTVLLPALSSREKGRSSSVYTGLPMDTTKCVYEITIYPSQEMQDQYVTEEPIMLAVGAFLIFVFTSAVFLLYDLCVARRQRIIKNHALASGAIVNSLFPEKVRDQLYQEQQPAQEQAKNKDTFRASIVTADDGEIVEERSMAVSTALSSSKPIADLFEETSVFFADIVGFTKWSSSRSPTEVFELLETLYGAFDLIAKRRSVFKVETIGDCYVAVTGIPNPQRDHAVILVKFARDAVTRMRQVLEDLVGILGVDTRDLDMRVGIHSGPVTAGVLRGEKGRFQLFGDSVNTAARMESNGKPGMIHVSQATADELTKAGKASWLRPREDKITAKGKGEMQTYFVLISSGRTSLASSSGDPTRYQQGVLEEAEEDQEGNEWDGEALNTVEA